MVAVVLLTICFTGCGESNKTTPNDLENNVETKTVILPFMNERQKLLKEMGRSDLPGKPILYGITDSFLDYFGLSKIEDLPKLEEIEEDNETIDLFDSKYKED